MAPPKRRVSYVIPPPVDHVPRLKLPALAVPRYGSPRPLILPSRSLPTHDQPERDVHPRHRLGVMALTLDTTTLLEGRASPGGILYTGGRDGQVISWDLNLPFRKRRNADLSHAQAARWERLTGMADDTLVAMETEEDSRDGDILGDVKESSGKWKDRNEARDGLPYEHQWELDLDAPEFHPVSQFLQVLDQNQPPYMQWAHFRQCVQLHTDWINDVLLCNYNQMGPFLRLLAAFNYPNWFLYSYYCLVRRNREIVESTHKSIHGAFDHRPSCRLCPLSRFKVTFARVTV